MATSAQLRALRKKHHLGEFRKKKSIKRHKIYRIMAKKRSVKRKYSKSSNFSGVWGNILGVGGYIVYESMVRPMLPTAIRGTVLSLAEIGVGLWLSKKSGVTGNVGKAMVTLNVYALLSAYIRPMLSGSSISTSTASTAFTY